jgi:SNF2 family DNA or RNA helicase
LKRIKPTHKIACTGTPAETKPDDLWSVLNWLYPGKFSSYWKFRKRHVATETFNGYPKIVGVMNIPELLRAIAPFYTRRLKEDVLKELPAKTYSELMVTLSPKQRREYDQMKKGMLSWVGDNEEQPLSAPALIAQLRRLQQFAISSIHMIDSHKWVTLETQLQVDRWNARVEQHNQEHPEDMQHRVKIGFKYKVPIKVAQMIEPSSKLDAVMGLIEDNPNEHFVVFSQFKQAIDLLGARLEKAKVTHGIYTGDTPKSERDTIVDEFQAGKRRVFAGTIRAGGEGITLTRASTMVFIDRDWSPSKNRQAEDRIHRMGQENHVHIIDIVAGSTVDRGRLQKIALTWSWLRQLLGDA